MKILQEFKEFAVRGSVVDLAVGVIVGGAFQKIVSSLVSDLLTPLLSLVTGGINFADRSATLRVIPGSDPVILKYGSFIQNVVDFVIVAFVIFLMVKGINRLRHEPEPEPEAPTAEEKLLIEIRDLLRQQAAKRANSN